VAEGRLAAVMNGVPPLCCGWQRQVDARASLQQLPHHLEVVAGCGDR